MALKRDLESGSTGRWAGQNPELLAAALDTAANAIFITDRTGRILFVNPAFEKLSGFTAPEALGKTPRILNSGKQTRQFYGEFWSTILAGAPWSGRVVNRRKTGELFIVAQTVTPITDEQDQISHFVAIHEDVTDRVEAERQVFHLARHDFLTGLPNRYTFNERLEHQAKQARRHGGRFALLMLDLDNFKSVNDNYGHSTGDELLVAAAARLLERTRATDTLARLGGDEFALLQTEVTGLEQTAELAMRLISSIEPRFDLIGQGVYTGASLGIALSGKDGAVDPEELLRQADLALYRAKEEGRNGFRFFDASMNDEIQRRLSLGQDLHRALEHGQFYLAYQPQVDLRSRTLVGVEALVRWRHPLEGEISPTEFVPIAEGNGLIVPIGEWVLRTACLQAKEWQEQDLPPITMAVNLSAVQFKRKGFEDTIFRILEESGLEPRFLELELTETTLMGGNEAIESSIRNLSAGGVRISLDDFGRAYSSLEYLRRFPLDKLKIDRSFVHEVRTSERDATILAAVVGLAGKLNLEVVAEGAGPDDQLDFLLAEGCQGAQGFFFAEPLSAGEIAHLIAQGSERIRPPDSV